MITNKMNNNLACIFPGQGSQSIGMLDSFNQQTIVKQTIEEASSALDEDINKIITQGPVEKLNSTVYTQPIMLACSIAIYRLWLQKSGTIPSILAGHSLGEYSALVASEAIDFFECIKLVRFRAKAMQNAVPKGFGTMAAIIGLDANIVVSTCQEITSNYSNNLVVQAANFNSKQQTVIAGNIEAVNKACEILKSKGAKKALVLPVSAPFHCSLLKPAGDELQEYLKNIKISTPKIQLLNNVDVNLYTNTTTEAEIKEALVRQVYSPVRWVETIEAIEPKVKNFVEMGVGKVLQGLVKRIISTNNTANIYTTDTLENLQASLTSLSYIPA